MRPGVTPLKFEGVVVGLVELTEDQTLTFDFKASSTETYLKELLAFGLISSISLDFEPIKGFQAIQHDQGYITSV